MAENSFDILPDFRHFSSPTFIYSIHYSSPLLDVTIINWLWELLIDWDHKDVDEDSDIEDIEKSSLLGQANYLLSCQMRSFSAINLSVDPQHQCRDDTVRTV